MQSSAQVLVAVVATDEGENVRGCVGSLQESTYRGFRVVVCENGGPAGFTRTVAALDEAGYARDSSADGKGGQVRFRLRNGQTVDVIDPAGNLGYSGGVNACIRFAGQDPWNFVWVLNPDTFPEPDAIKALVERQREGDYGIVGSRLIFVKSGLVQTWGGIRFNGWLNHGGLLGSHQPADTRPDVREVERQIDFISGASMFVSRAYYDTVGPMDEMFFVYDEDVDWSIRRGKFKLGYAHDSVVRHIHGSKSGSSLDRNSRSRFSTYLAFRNHVLLAKKHKGMLWPIPAASVLAQLVLELVRFRSWKHFGWSLQGFAAGLRNEKGPPPFVARPVQSPAQPRATPVDAAA